MNRLTEVKRSSRGYYFSLEDRQYDSKLGIDLSTHILSALEYDRFMTRTLAVCKCAYGLSGLVRVCGQ